MAAVFLAPGALSNIEIVITIEIGREDLKSGRSRVWLAPKIALSKSPSTTTDMSVIPGSARVLGGTVGRGSYETEEKKRGILAQSPMLPCMGRIQAAMRMCVSEHSGVG